MGRSGVGRALGSQASGGHLQVVRQSWDLDSRWVAVRTSIHTPNIQSLTWWPPTTETPLL